MDFLFGLAGTMANDVLTIHSGYRAFDTFFFDFMLSNYSQEEYNLKYIVFGLIFFGGSCLTRQLTKVFDDRFFKKNKRFGR